MTTTVHNSLPVLVVLGDFRRRPRIDSRIRPDSRSVSERRCHVAHEPPRQRIEPVLRLVLVAYAKMYERSTLMRPFLSDRYNPQHRYCHDGCGYQGYGLCF